MADSAPHIPLLRLGRPYRSLDTVEVKALGDGETVATMSMGNAGLVRRDARGFAAARAALRAVAVDRLLAIGHDAAGRFMEDALPLGDGATQTFDGYVDQLSLTSGLPHTLVRANAAKVTEVLTNLPTILDGLTRGLSAEAWSTGLGEVSSIPVSYFPTTEALGVVMPSNSPGVNALWLPSLAMQVPVILKPGREEPWTPWRLIQALYAAGLPRQAIGFYPTDHEGSAAVMDVCGRSIIFGGEATAKRYAGNPAVEVHGPGWSKVLIGDDTADDWEAHLDLLADSVAGNSGRSCINASTIWTPRHADALADALAGRLAAIAPLPRDHPEAKLSGIANPQMAAWADAQIEQGLRTPGAVDVTGAKRRGSPRVVDRDGVTYLLPTVIRCDSLDHPLADTEFMFPFAAVVEVPQAEMLARLKPSLVVTALTRDFDFRASLLAHPHIQRLNLGPIPTTRARWDQPHEGNLFELLYQRRSIAVAS